MKATHPAFEAVGDRFRIDGRKWMRLLRCPPWHVATLRDMKVGDTLYIGYHLGSVPQSLVPIEISASIEKIRGGYDAASLMIFIAKPGSRQRKSLAEFSLRFRLLPGSVIEFAPQTSLESERLFRMCCRYLDFIYRHAEAFGVPKFDRRENGYFRNGGMRVMWRGEVVYPNNRTKHGGHGPLSGERTDALISEDRFHWGAVVDEDFFRDLDLDECSAEEPSPTP